ncbi:MAG: metal ABC transporter permease [Spirochaetales bacterium]|nr:metal ABC transporter permease [Spirochaetales bacterium]
MTFLSSVVQWLTEPFLYGFVTRGLVAGLLAGIACSALSAFVVWRGMAFMGDAIAHAVLPGIVLAYSLGIGLFFGALGAAIFAVFGIGLLSKDDRLKEDTAIGVMFSGLFALGIIMLSRSTSGQDLSHVLFGNILGVNTSDIGYMAIVVGIVLISLKLFHKEVLVTSFDPAHAVAIGLSPSLIRYGLLMLVALTTVIAIQTVGVVMVLALLVTPGAAASLLSHNLKKIIRLSLVFSTSATVVGFYASYYGNFPSGPIIVLTLTVFFLGAFVYVRLRRI